MASDLLLRHDALIAAGYTPPEANRQLARELDMDDRTVKRVLARARSEEERNAPAKRPADREFRASA